MLILQSIYELTIISLVTRLALTISGDFAEVGVFGGGSAKIICMAKKARHLYLFDTFQGMPKPAKEDTGIAEFTLRASIEDVERELSSYPNVHIYKGLFPQTAEGIRNKTFAFVHLDADLYESTKQSLEFFYPRMVKGGIILMHDYQRIKGVTKAIDEFYQAKPEPVEMTSSSQALIFKV